MANRQAGYLRRNQTDAERLLWRVLRSRNLGEYKFRRQHPIGSFKVGACSDCGTTTFSASRT